MILAYDAFLFIFILYKLYEIKDTEINFLYFIYGLTLIILPILSYYYIKKQKHNLSINYKIEEKILFIYKGENLIEKVLINDIV